MTTLQIDKKMKNLWENIYLGCMTYSISIEEKNESLWSHFENAVLPPLLEKLSATELVDMPQIGPTRQAFKAFGIPSGKYRVSSEALYRRVRQGKPLYQINSLVDVNNIISLISGLSLGSYDADKVGESILLRLGLPDESYQGIGKTEFNLENIPLLSDNMGAFGSPISDSTRGMIDLTTKKGITILYSFSNKDIVQKTLVLAKDMFEQYTSITEVKTIIIE